MSFRSVDAINREVKINKRFQNHCMKVSKYGVFPGPYFSVFSPNTEKYSSEKAPYLDTFHAANILWNSSLHIGILHHFVEFILANHHKQQHFAEFTFANWDQIFKLQFRAN